MGGVSFSNPNASFGFGFGFGAAGPPPPRPPPPAVEVLISEESPVSAANLEPVVVDDTLSIYKGRVNSSDVFGVKNSDLVPGKYEGGLKPWEGSLDLVKTLTSDIKYNQLLVEGKRVLECLHYPGGVVYLAGKKHYFGIGGGTRQFLHLVTEDGRPSMSSDTLNNRATLEARAYLVHGFRKRVKWENSILSPSYLVVKLLQSEGNDEVLQEEIVD